MKLIAHSASAAGTSGRPKRFIARRSVPVELERRAGSAGRRAGRRRRASVPTKLPTIAPIAPLCAPTTSAIVAPIVISDVRDARDREPDRPLLDPEERRHLRVVHLRPEPDEAGADESGSSRLSQSAIWAAKRHPTASPSVAIPIVNQNEVPDHERPARSVVGVEVEAEERARDPEPQHDHEQAVSATIVSIFPNPTGPR